MSEARRTEEEMAAVLLSLLHERNWSVRKLALEAKISQPQIWRILRHQPGGRPTPATVLAISRALGLPDDYFPEVREARVIEALRADPKLRERIYRQIARR